MGYINRALVGIAREMFGRDSLNGMQAAAGAKPERTEPCGQRVHVAYATPAAGRGGAARQETVTMGAGCGAEPANFDTMTIENRV